MYARDYGNTPGTVRAFEEAYAERIRQDMTETPKAPPVPAAVLPTGQNADTRRPEALLYAVLLAASEPSWQTILLLCLLLGGK